MLNTTWRWAKRWALPAAGAAGLASLALIDPALAQEAAAEGPPISNADTAWVQISSALVLLMLIPGLALFYGGMVRKANVLAILMQCFAICALISVVWFGLGYSLAFSNGNSFIGGLDKVFMSDFGVKFAFVNGAGLDNAVTTTIPESVFAMFQMTFAIITPALIVGAFADRMKFSALLIFSVLWSLVVYAPICHWVWQPNGFLFAWGVLDFAGGTVVHINAGVAGLVAALILGPRRGYGTSEGHIFAPHNLVLSVIGASLLWVGWFGFNAGSWLAADGRSGMAFLVTHLATAGAALAWMFIEWAVKGKASVLGIISGAVAGLVAVTPAAGFVGPGSALLIGAISGAVCFVACTSIKKAMGYDDSLDAFGVHGVGGIVGALLTGVFASEAISGYAGGWDQFVLQVYGVGISIAYSAVATAILLYIVKAIVGLRVSEDVERDGLDLALHGETVQ